jgi:hypothetical protein
MGSLASRLTVKFKGRALAGADQEPATEFSEFIGGLT